VATIPLESRPRAADWLELLMITSTTSRLTRSDLEDLLERARPDWSEQQIEEEAILITKEFDRRIHAAGTVYPFARNGKTIRYDTDKAADDRALYAFLTLVSAEPKFRQRSGTFMPDRIFEHLTRIALKVVIAGDSRVFAETPPGEKPGIRPAIERLGRLLYVDSYPARARTSRKDHGLDVVAWRPFADKRPSAPIILCQCTVSWQLIPKAREIQREEWAKLLDITAASVTAAIAIPHVIGLDYPKWQELRWNTDLILDRVRMLELLALAPTRGEPVMHVATELQNGLNAWHAANAP
jgi:hypothetical protein